MPRSTGSSDARIAWIHCRTNRASTGLVRKSDEQTHSRNGASIGRPTRVRNSARERLGSRKASAKFRERARQELAGGDPAPEGGLPRRLAGRLRGALRR